MNKVKIHFGNYRHWCMIVFRWIGIFMLANFLFWGTTSYFAGAEGNPIEICQAGKYGLYLEMPPPLTAFHKKYKAYWRNNQDVCKEWRYVLWIVVVQQVPSDRCPGEGLSRYVPGFGVDLLGPSTPRKL